MAAKTKAVPLIAEPKEGKKTMKPSLKGLPGSVKELAPGDWDKLIHEKTRLGILSSLAVTESAGFNDLKQWLGVTDGSLSVHARKLEEAGYLKCRKTFRGRVPHTEYRLTPKGRAALKHYLEHMEALIQAVQEPK